MADITDEKRKKILDSLTDEQKKIYDNLVGNEDRLKQEFTLCSKFYEEAVKVIFDKSAGPEVRLLLRGVSDYWQRRMKCMERSLEILVGKDTVRRIKNAKS